MATTAQIIANTANANLSTGPRTEAGKSAVAVNAVKLGLFCKRDFVRPEDDAEYTQLRDGLLHDLSPEGTLEETLVVEIVTASWRLRRCATVESGLIDRCLLDPMEDPSVSRIQATVDRARTQAHGLLRRSLAELRRIQTDRAIHREVAPVQTPEQDDGGVISFREVISALHRYESLRRKQTAAPAIPRYEDLLAGLPNSVSDLTDAA